jgi:hypothetical protein
LGLRQVLGRSPKVEIIYQGPQVRGLSHLNNI